MRQGGPNNGRRPRGRHHGGGGHNGGGHGGHGGQGHVGGGNVGRPDLRDNRPRSAASLRHQTFDSNCIEVRVRGNAWQVHEKYQALARDAQSAGDRVAAEHYLQHAEHYFRIIEAINEATAAEQQARGITPSTNNAPPTYGQQPEVPNNYYGTGNPQQQQQPNGAPANTGNNGNTDGSNASGAPQQMAQAEVQQRNAPQAQNPFFAADENEDQSAGVPPLVARR